MKCCTFFGHRDSPSSAKDKLRATLVDLIENEHVDTFYVGTQGKFDAMVHSILKELKTQYPIQYAVVLAYLPTAQTSANFSDTIYPEGIEEVPKRFAISWRNNWMIEQADYVVTYIEYTFGGAYQFAEKAHKKGKTIINIADKPATIA